MTTLKGVEMYTTLSAFTDEELIAFATMKDNRSELEEELGHRLSLAVDLIAELEEELDEITEAIESAGIEEATGDDKSGTDP
jgi:hypothetical protein